MPSAQLIAVLAFAGNLSVAPGGSATTERALPPGITNEAVFRLLVPDYEASLADARAHPTDPAYSPFSPHIADSLETDLGVPGRKYLLLAVQAPKGSCGSCYPTYFAILDLKDTRIVWHFENVGLYTPPRLRAFKLAGNSAVLTFSFRSVVGSQGCCSWETEHWVQPRVTENEIEFDEIWSSLVDLSNGGNRGGSLEQGCGWISTAPGGRGYIYRRDIFFGSLCELPEGSYEPQELGGLSCSQKVARWAECGTVEIRRVEHWSVEKSRLRKVKQKTERLDYAKSESFPFSLPVRRDRYRQREKLPLDSSTRVVTSPDGGYRVEVRKSALGRQDLLLLNREGDQKRIIPFHRGDDFEGTVDALGWLRNGERFFAVVRFGLDPWEDRVLLSFGTQGEKDYWEKLLTDDLSEWRDGFVLAAAHRR